LPEEKATRVNLPKIFKEPVEDVFALLTESGAWNLLGPIHYCPQTPLSRR